MIKRQWLARIAESIERDHGAEKRRAVVGNAADTGDTAQETREWFEGFARRLDEPGFREYAKDLLARCCPCRCPDIERNVRKNYTESRDLREFKERLDADGLFEDAIELRDGAMFVTKKDARACGVKHPHDGPYSERCHCPMASTAGGPVPDVFCHCCTVGYYRTMFREALGMDVRVEFVSSVVSGGEGCTAAIYLPGKA